jgi:hypothetical protein
MANSLKALLPMLGRVLGETPDALYAYQRAFVRAGLLESAPGRGPGSGTSANPETLAEFLIGMLTHASLSDNVATAKAIGRAVPGGDRCHLTGATTFKKALAAVLVDKSLAERVNEIRITINGGFAVIQYDGSSEVTLKGLAKPAKITRQPESSVFMGKVFKGPGLRFDAAIPSDTLRKLVDVIGKAGIS